MGEEEEGSAPGGSAKWVVQGSWSGGDHEGNEVSPATSSYRFPPPGLGFLICSMRVSCGLVKVHSTWSEKDLGPNPSLATYQLCALGPVTSPL